MADSSLDDFFAKKDKSKKSKKKYTLISPDEMVKQLEETGKQNEKQPKKEKEKTDPRTGIQSQVNLKLLEQVQAIDRHRLKMSSLHHETPLINTHFLSFTG